MPILYHSGVARVKKKLMRGYVQIWCDLRTIFDICEDLTRSVDISRPAPENSLALFYDNPRKLYLDSRQLALYNIVMKKRKKFDIQEWLKHNEDKHEQWHQHWRVIRFHPLTWLLIMIAIAYGFEL